jgi:hypothetical protein
VWLRVLYDLLINLDFQQVASVESIDGVLSRWAQMDDKDGQGKPFEGYDTSLPLKDEFRCLVAALYGRGFVKNKTVLHGSVNSNEIAVRCAFYGKVEITAKDIGRHTSATRMRTPLPCCSTAASIHGRRIRTHVRGNQARVPDRSG